MRWRHAACVRDPVGRGDAAQLLLSLSRLGKRALIVEGIRAAGTETEPECETGWPHAMPAGFKILADFAAGCKSAGGTDPDRPRALCAAWDTIVPISSNGLEAGAEPDNDGPRALLAGLMRAEPASEARLEAACGGEARLEVDSALAAIRVEGSSAANAETCSLAGHFCPKEDAAEVVRVSSRSSGRGCIPLTSGIPVLAARSRKWLLLNAC